MEAVVEGLRVYAHIVVLQRTLERFIQEVGLRAPHEEASSRSGGSATIIPFSTGAGAAFIIRGT